jgi:hydroxylaminobenzene mutase
VTQAQAQPQGPPQALRHPADPDPVRSAKATAVYLLGIAAVITGPFVGGVIPGTIALLLAAEVRRDLHAANGYLIGTSRYQRGVKLAWAGIVFSIAAIVVVIIRTLYVWAQTGSVDFSNTN